MAKKVLIIDDSITQLSSLKIFFQRNGFEIETASNGVEGFVKVYKTTPDVIVSDVLMPHLNGFQLCRLLKSSKETKDIPFISLTVLDKNIDKFWASQCGADVFLRKDFDMSKIVDMSIELMKKMPVTDDMKDNLRQNDIDEDSVISQINKILDYELMKTTITNKFRELTSYTKDDKALASDIFKILSSIIDYDFACIYFYSPDTSVKKNLVFHEQNVAVNESIIEDVLLTLFPNEKDFRTEITDLKGDYLEEAESISEFAYFNKMEFKYENILTGKICFYSKEAPSFEAAKFIETVRSELDLFLRLKYLYSKTCYLSITDELTKLYTRRHLNSAIVQEFERSKRYGTISTVAMLDIDDFKKINDKYGHLAGDYVLREIAKILVKALRKSDFVYRYGGEEICMLMPETKLENASIPLERIRKSIQDKEFIFEDEKIKVTVSIGAAIYTKSMKEARNLIEAADSALYTAKKNGKNQVVMQYE